VRFAEPIVLEHLSDDARSTSEVVKAVLGLKREPTALERTHIYIALTELEKDGLVESRRSYDTDSHHEVRFWVLAGGRFPEDHTTRSLASRMEEALRTGPMTTRQLYDAVFTETERVDEKLAMKRLWHALNRQRSSGRVRMSRGERGAGRPSVWEWIE